MIEIHNEEELIKVVKEHEIVVVLFSSSWCHPCQKMKKLLEEVVSETAFNVQIATLDVEKHGHLTLKNNISIIPTLHYYKSGNVFLKESGLKTSSVIRQNIQALIKISSI